MEGSGGCGGIFEFSIIHSTHRPPESVRSVGGSCFEVGIWIVEVHGGSEERTSDRLRNRSPLPYWQEKSGSFGTEYSDF